MKKLILFFCIFILTPLFTSAEESPLEFSGYYKNLSTFTKSVASEENISAVLNRLRLEVKKEIDPWTFYAAIDNELIFHDFQNTAEFGFIRSRAQASSASWDWDQISADDRHHYSRHAIYRATIQYYDPKYQVTIGKQGIDWGVMRFYSPNDIFNTVGPIDLEYDERVGVDAININYAFDDFSGLNFVAVPDGDDEDFMMALKAYKTIKTYDTAFMIGKVRDNFLVGVTFDGYLKDAGFRGELQYMDRDDSNDFVRASVGLDYSLNEDFYLLFEQFYNEGASGSFATFAASYLSSLQFLSAEKNLSSIWAKYSFTPLLDWNNYIIYDWDGGSFVYNPELHYNITDNVELKFGTQLYFGSGDSEFGAVEHLYYGQIQWFF